jgi:hypothetical protein
LPRLPAWLAASAAPTTATAWAPATTTAATRTSTAAAESATATTAAAAEPAIGFGPRLIHIQRAAVHRVTIESGNRLIRFPFIFHFDKREPARTAGVAIRHDTCAVNLPIPLKQAAHGFFRNVEVEVAHKYVLHSILLTI